MVHGETFKLTMPPIPENRKGEATGNTFADAKGFSPLCPGFQGSSGSGVGVYPLGLLQTLSTTSCGWRPLLCRRAG